MKKFFAELLRIWNAETTSFRWSVFVIALSMGIVLGAALLVFIVDPHYRYRKPFFYDMVYHKLYATAPHILRHQEYDLLMIGTSMTRNFYLNDIDKAFGCRSVKLAAAGGTMTDICKFLDIALEAKGEKLKQILLSLDIYSLNKTSDMAHYKEFDYLYRNDFSQEYRYLFSRDTYSTMIHLLKRKLRPKGKRAFQTDRNRMFATEHKKMKFGLKPIMKDALKNLRSHHTQTPYNEGAFKENFYGRLLGIVDKNPQVRFTVYLPPYHIYTYCQSEQFKEADPLIRQRTQVLLELLKHSNVTLFDFQSDRRFVENPDYFSDIQHFGSAAARKILEELKKEDRKLVSQEQIRKNEAALRQLIRENMPRYHKHLKEFGAR